MNEAKANNSRRKNGAQPLLYVVDDEAMILELATVILEPLGYEVRTFRDPEQALEAFSAAQCRPALVITDYSMHHMSGLDLIESFRQIEPEQKILLVSGTVGPEVFYASPCKPDRFLAKPYQISQLVDVIRLLIAK